MVAVARGKEQSVNLFSLSAGRPSAGTSLFHWFAQLDQLLRGETTRPADVRGGVLDISTAGLSLVIVLLAVIYGVCMGSFSLLKDVPADLSDDYGRYWQLLATMLKVPALFYMTLLVTFPSLYVFNALVGSRLNMRALLQLLIASLAVNLAVLSSLGPIVLFFSLSTNNYQFIVLLNVIVFTVAGVLGLIFLLQTLHRMTDFKLEMDFNQAAEVGVDLNASNNPGTEEESPTASSEPSALDMPPGQMFSQHTRVVFRCWVVLFAIVGAQMGWVLRPFVGNPHDPFAWFRDRESNFFANVIQKLGALLIGGD